MCLRNRGDQVFEVVLRGIRRIKTPLSVAFRRQRRKRHLTEVVSVPRLEAPPVVVSYKRNADLVAKRHGFNAANWSHG
jgi:hypothetical protein